jgi:hypothetical protein
MKHIIIAGSLILCSHAALAESTISCKVQGGSEQGLALAPATLVVGEAGLLSLSVNGKKIVKIEIGNSENLFYGSSGMKISLPATKTLVGHSIPVSGEEHIVVKGCEADYTGTASYDFSYEINKKTVSAGMATYKCVCSMD